MFGMGGTEIIVILIVALLFLGPDKLPGAAKSISKGIRDIKKQTRALQNQIEGDEQIGGAIRDLKSALRGEDEPSPRRIKPSIRHRELDEGHVAEANMTGSTAEVASLRSGLTSPLGEVAPLDEVAPLGSPPPLRMPATAGAPDDVADPGTDEELAHLVKPASGTVAKGS